MWEFDDSVAKRFQHEAICHIPDYERVIDICLTYTDMNYSKEAFIIDIGSALGYTMDKFISAGYNNVYGIEISESMRNSSLHKERVYNPLFFPPTKLWDVIIMNWTLHFIENKVEYLKNIYSGLEDTGTFILSDKTVQSERIKEMYYRFKSENGVSDEYIKQKEIMLQDSMFIDRMDWYLDALEHVGFTVEIINSKYGFHTFLCRKR
jgi:tRNA (cmo5U34)-methyltransferase